VAAKGPTSLTRGEWSAVWRRARRARNVARHAAGRSLETRVTAMLQIMRARELHDAAASLRWRE
jgi:hypothetical protein